MFLLYLYQVWKKYGVAKHAAAMSYYLFIGFISLSLLLSSLLKFFSTDFLEQRTLDFLEQYAGEQVSQVIQLLVFSPSAGNVVAASVFSFVLLVFSAGIGFNQLSSSLDEIIDDYKRRSFLENLKDRLFSSILLVFLIFLFVVFILVSSLLSIIVSAGFSFFNIPFVFFSIISFIFNFVMIALFLMLIFQYLPSSKRPWRGVINASFLSASLFILGKYLFETYFIHSNLGGLQGITGYIIVFLIWLYYTSISIIIGAVYIKYKTGTGH